MFLQVLSYHRSRHYGIQPALNLKLLAILIYDDILQVSRDLVRRSNYMHITNICLRRSICKDQVHAFCLSLYTVKASWLF